MSLEAALALQVASAEFQADEKVAAVSFAQVAADGYPASFVASLADDYSPAACRDTAAAAVLGQLQTAGGEPDQDDRCPQERCGFLEEQADCQARRAEGHCHSDERPGWRCRGLLAVERSGYC